jgi:ABC-type cobalamin transport system ATPase subunit
MNLFRSEEHARRWSRFEPRSEDGFISLAELAGLFGTESRGHMLDGDYLSSWYPRRAAERRAYLERIGKTSPFWMGTTDPPASG